MAESLYFYKLVSPYYDSSGHPEDVTKNCKLTVNEIDSNFLTLKDYDVKTAEFIREEKTLILTRNNGEKIIVPLNDIAYNLEANTASTESGMSLTIFYDGSDGEKEVTISNILTFDNLSKVIGSKLLTKVITDGTIKGFGTMAKPLGIAGTERTGSLAPAIEVLDLTNGDKLPENVKYGSRYITKEYVSDYGYLYNDAGVKKIEEKLANEFISENTKDEDKKFAWHVPSKQDWDVLLNSLEPYAEGCMCRNHDSNDCHVELGCIAGKMLKSECGWVNQPKCECSLRNHGSGCNDDIDDEEVIPPYDTESPSGVDNYGMTILPAGYATINRYNNIEYSVFGENAFFWTTTKLAEGQDTFVKVFDCDKSGVYQVAECPEPYYSIRLVKEYDGNNYYDSEYIDGILYKTILFPETQQIWLASNYADTDGFVPYSDSGETAEFLNLGDQLQFDRRIELFINEWNGKYWEKRAINEGETVVIQDPCYNKEGSATTTTVVWYDRDNNAHEIEIDVPKIAQSNVEYRANVIDDFCNKDLVNTDDIVVERVLDIVIPMLEEERWERVRADEALSGAIDDERAEREMADNELREALSTEIEERKSADDVLSGAIDTLSEAVNVLSGAIDDERADRESAVTEIWEALSAETEERIAEVERLDNKINEEITRATERENGIEDALNEEIERAKNTEEEISGLTIDTSVDYTISAANENEDYNLTLKSKDGVNGHFIKIKFDGNFGEI